MDSKTLGLIAKFAVRARKLIGSINIKQFTDDQAYREEVFSQVEENADEALMMLSLSLREAFNPSEKKSPSQPKAEEDAKAKESEKAPTKYVFGLRG